MGSVQDSPAEEFEEFTVLVTGFDAFKSEYPQNPSWEIARRLPEYLPARTKTASSTASSTTTAPSPASVPPVRIVVYPGPVRVNYQAVRTLVPTLWDGTPTKVGGGAYDDGKEDKEGREGTEFTPPKNIDLVLHIGMAGPRLHYALERVGRRDGYTLRDVDDQLLGDTPADRGDPRWPWYGVPAALESHLDLDDVLARWRGHAAPGADLRISVDAGRYLCDFIYFSSLAHLYRRDQEADHKDARYARRRVAFLHVPAAATPERVEAGRALVVELIRSLVESEVVARGNGDTPVANASAAAASAAAPGADTVTGKWYRD
ncbi:pyroglutamyl peptidase type [Sporothrix schenckii 1099-18]|uniref:Pyroglutamyl peptidase type I n=2 Tax=Sporothrix schenckii TaxID=29908 RepID=U7PLB2_SPOS1|nr:pyroglutamyl peptidase type [Sporothrix schenckii 1099-18]ERS95509.1 hypothetical protein HMPREF1624_08025 [Sporothrix schenckii ATCC 58251]KJR86795.1 pyroglutamyl peptidase type [Sporothrix schenckii 1099-18]